MRAILRWAVYLVLMLVVGFIGLVVSSMTMGGSEMATEAAPTMLEMAPAEHMPAPAPAPPARNPTGLSRMLEGSGDGGDGGGGRAGKPPPAPSDPFAAADRALERLEQANIAFNTPDELTVGKSEMVQLLLSMRKTVEELKATITAKGTRDGATVEVSNKMEAKLTGAGFDIRAITPEVQIVSPTMGTEWKWEVEPVSTDARRLHLTLSAHVMLDGEKVPRVVKTFERTMTVNVNWANEAYSFATGNWEWLWATLLVPVAGEIWRRRKKGKKRA